MKKVDPILKPLKSTNAALQAQVNFQRQIIQSTEAIIIVLDANTTIKSISKGAEKILGFSSKELVNKKWFETLVIKNTLKEHQTKFKEFLSSNKKYREGLVPVICKDGSIKKINWKTNKIFEQKKLIGTVALGKDVTAYEERVDVLKESEKKFRDLAELLPTAISCKTTDNKIIFLNKAYTQQFGYTLKDIPDFDAWLQIAYKNNKDRKKAATDWKNAVAILKSGKKTKTSLITVYNKKNEKRILKHDTTLSGKNIYCSYYDVTEEVEKENKLKANEIKFRKLAEQMQHPVVFVNINGEFVFLNKAFAKQFGFNIKDFPDVASIINHMNINATEKKKRITYFIDEIKSLFRNKKSISKKIEIETKWGDKKFLEYAATLAGDYVYYVYTDITLQKLREKELQKATAIFKQIAENTPVAVAGCNATTFKVEFVNKHFVNILGYNQKQINKYDDWGDLIVYENDLEKEILLQEWQQVKMDLFANTKAKVKTLERRLLCSNGIIKNFEVGITYDNGIIYALFYDITARKQQENKLRESEEKFRKLAELVPIPVSFITRTGEIVYFNKAYTDEFGYTVESTPTIDKLFAISYKDENEKRIAYEFWNDDVKKLTNRLPVEPKRFVAYDISGKRKIMEYSATISGSFIYYAYLDVTAQIEKEALLISSKETFERIAEHTPIPVGGCNIETFDLTFSNKKFEEIFGHKYTDNVKFDEWYKKIIYESNSEKEAKEKEFKEYVAALIQNKPIDKEIIEHKVLCIDKKIRTFEVGLTFDNNSIYSFFYDVTQRKEAELNLRESEARFRNLAEQMFLPVACIDANGKFIFLNQSFINHFGYSIVDFPDIKTVIENSKKANKKTKQKGIENWEAEIKILFEKKKQIKNRMEAETVNGEKRYVEYVATLADNFAYYVYTDVTEQKVKEDNLIKSRNVFRSIAENTPIAIAGCDAMTYDVNFLNKKFKQDFGYNEQELKYFENWRSLIIYNSKTEKQAAFLNWQKIIITLVNKQKNEVKTLERRLKRKDGTIGTFEIGLTYDSNTIYAFFYDITDRKIAEQKLVASEARFRNIVENLPLPLVSINAESKVIYTNKKHTELVGHNNSNAYSKQKNILQDYSIDDLIDEDDKRRFNETITLLENNNTDSHIVIPAYITKILCTDNQIRIFEISENIFGKTLYTLFNDITQQTLAREALIESEQKFRVLAENMPIAIGAYDEAGKTSFVNKFFTQVTGYTIKDVPSVKQWYKLTQPKLTKRIEFYNYWETLVNNFKSGKIKEPVTVASTALCKDGTFRNFSFSFSVYNNITYLLLIDITEQEKAKQQLEKSHQELRTLASYLQTIREEERKTISREIHDELGQQITGIKMDISAVFRKSKVRDAEEELNRKEIIDALNTTIKSVRKIATQLRPSILDDLGVIATFEWLIQDFKKRTGINCNFYYDTEENNVSADVKNNLFRILQESLTNIMRHSSATTVNIDFFTVSDQIRLIIADNGKGFNQNSPKATLGILGMRERTAMLNGSFVIVSEKQKGTRIIISIPIKK